MSTPKAPGLLLEVDPGGLIGGPEFHGLRTGLALWLRQLAADYDLFSRSQFDDTPQDQEARAILLKREHGAAAHRPAVARPSRRRLVPEGMTAMCLDDKVRKLNEDLGDEKVRLYFRTVELREVADRNAAQEMELQVATAKFQVLTKITEAMQKMLA